MYLLISIILLVLALIFLHLGINNIIGTIGLIITSAVKGEHTIIRWGWSMFFTLVGIILINGATAFFIAYLLS